MNKIFLKGNVFTNTVRFIENKTEFMQFYISFVNVKDKKYSRIKCICFGEVAKKIINAIDKESDGYFKAFVEGKLAEEEYNGAKYFFIIANNVSVIK